MSDLTTLNSLFPGWTESGSTGLICNPHPAGGIIDKTILTGEWFVVFNDGRPTIEDLGSRDEAVKAFVKAAPVSRRLESDLISPLLRKQQNSEKAQATLSFDAFDLPLFAGR